MSDKETNKHAFDNSSSAYLALKKLIDKVCTLQESEWNHLVETSPLRTFKKHELILTANKPGKCLWFIAQGLVRNFYTTESGKEFNKSFVAAPGFFGSITEIVSGTPSRFSIEALESTTVIAIPIDYFKKTSHSNNEFKTLALTLVEQLAIKKEQREAELLLDNATTRYQNFVQNNPHLNGRIPAYHIASYLGITEVALSRIKRNLNT